MFTQDEFSYYGDDDVEDTLDNDEVETGDRRQESFNQNGKRMETKELQANKYEVVVGKVSLDQILLYNEHFISNFILTKYR